LLPFTEWWNQVVLVIDRQPITRRSLVLAAADKDGGAHVDAALTKEYEALIVNFGEIVTTYADGTEARFAVDNAHFMALRQIAYEILNSPDLAALLGEEQPH